MTNKKKSDPAEQREDPSFQEITLLIDRDVVQRFKALGPD